MHGPWLSRPAIEDDSPQFRQYYHAIRNFPLSSHGRKLLTYSIADIIKACQNRNQQGKGGDEEGTTTRSDLER
jgi:hypothetical protein